MRLSDTTYPLETMAEAVVELFVRETVRYPEVRVQLIEKRQELIEWLAHHTDAISERAPRWMDRALKENEAFISGCMIHWFYVRFTDSFPQVKLAPELEGITWR